jgi:hypothetical protein
VATRLSIVIAKQYAGKFKPKSEKNYFVDDNYIGGISHHWMTILMEFIVLRNWVVDLYIHITYARKL